MLSPNGNAEVSIPYVDAHELSMKMLGILGETEPGLKEVATAMTLARLLAFPKILTPDEEGAYVEAVFDLSASMWPEGEMN